MALSAGRGAGVAMYNRMNMFSISLAQIQRFLVAAELLNFTKAAEELNLTQPVMSKSIAAIEHALGLILFIRERGTVTLTPAGRHLFQFWSAMMPTIEHNIIKAHVLQKGTFGQLAVGIHNFYDLSYFFMPIINRFRQKYPEVALSVLCFSFPELRHRVLNGQLDAAFTSRFEGDDIRETCADSLEVRDLLYFPLSVNMLPSNPLAVKDRIAVEDLRYQRFIVHSPAKVPTYKTLIDNMCMEAGFIPTVDVYIQDATSFALSLDSDDKVYVVDRAAKIEPGIPVRSFDLEGTRSGVSLVWSKKCAAPSLPLLLEETELFFREHPDPYCGI